MSRRVALFGGSFNPPHSGHVLTVAWALTCLDLDEVLVVPTYDHAFGKELASYDLRLEMVALAMAPFAERVTVSTIERDLGGESRTIRVVDALRAQEPDLEIVLLVGTDILGEFHLWLEAERLQRETEIVVLRRGGYPSTDRRVRGPLLPEVSSTQLRALLRRGDLSPVRELVPRAVVDAIVEAEAYGMDEPVAAQGRVWIVGAGRVGVALGLALREAGWEIRGIWSRSEARARDAGERLGAATVGWGTWPEIEPVDLVLITVVDDAVADVARAIRGAVPDGAVTLHASGVLSAETLVTAGYPAERAGSVHPLVAVPDVRDCGPRAVLERLRDVYFAIDGGSRALVVAEALVDACAAIQVAIRSAAKPLYHASAVIVSNYLVTLFALAADLLVEEGGVEPELARAMLHRLLTSAADNLGVVAPGEALTGPIRRGDVATVERHLVALEASAREETLSVYRALLPATIRLAVEQGLRPGVAARLVALAEAK